MTKNVPPGWYPAEGLPYGTVRFWDGQQWVGAPKPADQVPGPEASMAPTSRLASPWQRLGARFLDGLILFIPIVLVSAPFLLPAFQDQLDAAERGVTAPATETTGVVIAGLLVGLLATAYEFYFLNKRGATIGKKSVGIKVVRTDGSDVVSVDVLKRLALSIGAIFAGLVPILGDVANSVLFIALAIMIFTDKKRQTPSDKIADTIVITD